MTPNLVQSPSVRSRVAVAVRRGAGLLVCAALAAATPAVAAPVKPKLIVAISVDQLSGALFDASRDEFGGGLKRLSEGVVYPSGYQAHAATETCPGHSTLLTGKHPNKTGIVANDYRDPETGRTVYCLNDPSRVLAHGGTKPPVGPARMMASTLGEWLKAASPASKVVAVAGKDRGAIAMAGHDPDGVFWIEPGYGFTTYMAPGADPQAALAPVAAPNAAQGEVWRKPPTWTYGDGDCRSRESRLTLGGRDWVSKVPPTEWGVSSAPAAISRDVMTSPIADDLTLNAARHLIRHYKLGADDAPDLLSVGFSATDYVGHRYGSLGPEMCEQLRRLDTSIGRLLADLDGLDIPYLVVLTADHGALDVIERLQAQGYPAGRVDGAAALARANAAVVAELRLAKAPLTGSLEEVFIDGAPSPEAKTRIAAAAARAIAAQPEVAAAFTLTELLATSVSRDRPADELSVRERFALSAFAGRSPDVVAALHPYTSANRALPGAYVAGHGSVWNYDRRVPILFWSKDGPRETRSLPVRTVDIAPTLAAVLGLTTPPDVDGRCLPLGELNAACR